MVLKYIYSTFLLVVIVFSEVYGRKIKSHTTPDITEIVKNASKVNNLLQNVIKNYKKLEKLETSGSEETDRKTDQESNESFDKDTNKRGRSHDKIISTSEKSVRKPMIYFSDKTSVEGESETGEKQTVNEKHDYKSIESITTTVTTMSTKSAKRQQDKEKKHEKIIEKLLRQGTKQMKADKSSNEDKVIKPVKAKKRVKAAEKHSKEEKEPVRGKDTSDDENNNMSTHSPRINKVRGNPRHKKSEEVSQETTSKSNQLKTHSPKSKSKKVSPDDEKISEFTTPVVTEVKSEDELVMENEVSKAQYLREAYLDACKVVIVRKCRRALRSVSKDVCSRSRKCSGNFKDEFRKNGINSCDAQFANKNTGCRSGIGEDTEARRILTGVRSSKEPETNSSIPVNKKIHKMNILRDRYEKACKKDSYKKCRAACKEASIKTCKKYECTDLKANAFRKACRRRCIEVFQVTGEDADSDGDDEYDDDDENRK